jgi:3-oxoacyl-[acyl-carrier-protein] synthase II
MRRVVVTGLGMVTPLGCGVEPTWARILSGASGAGPITSFDASDLPARIACNISRGDGTDGTFNPDDWMEPKEQRKVDDFIVFAMAAAKQALTDANWAPESYEDQTATGVAIGSGIGGLGGIYEASILLKERGPRRLSPFFIPGRLSNLAAGYVSIENQLKGPNHAVVTACSTGAHAIGDAARMVALGDAEVMVAGGTESAINRLGIAGFCACRALSTGFNDTPEKASRPYDKDRDGFVMGEGAGVVVLEELEHALARGARIYAEITGYGMSGDAYHITSPSEDGDGAYRCMSAALNRAGLTASDLDYLDAARRRDRTARGRAASGQCLAQAGDVLDQIGHGPSARRRRRDRGDLLDPGDSRPDRAADDQSRQPLRRDRSRSRASCRQEAPHRRCAVEFLRLWWDQRLSGDAALRRLSSVFRGAARFRHNFC